jgi:PEP-CTERM motif
VLWASAKSCKACAAASAGRPRRRSNLQFADYTPTIGESFQLIQTTGLFTGNFDRLTANGYTLSVSFADNWLSATVTGIAPAVPEPGTWALMLAGGLGVLSLARRRETARH